jgi:hypothetical protein
MVRGLRASQTVDRSSIGMVGPAVHIGANAFVARGVPVAAERPAAICF